MKSKTGSKWFIRKSVGNNNNNNMPKCKQNCQSAFSAAVVVVAGLVAVVVVARVVQHDFVGLSANQIPNTTNPKQRPTTTTSQRKYILIHTHTDRIYCVCR